MLVQSAIPLYDPNFVQHWAMQNFPGMEVSRRGSHVLIGNGLVTGVLINNQGPHHAKLVWAMPNMGVQIILILLIVLSLLPGLVIFLIVWLAAKGGIDQLKQHVATTLQTGGMGAAPGMGQMAQGGWHGQQGYPQQQQGYPQQQGGYPQQQQQGYAQAPHSQQPQSHDPHSQQVQSQQPGSQEWGGGQQGGGWGQQ